MKTRIIAGVIGAVLLAVLLWQPYALVLASAVALLCGMAAYELTVTTGFVKSRPLQAICILAAASVPFWYFIGFKWALLCGATVLMAVGIVQVIDHARQPVTHAVFSVVMSLWAAMSMSCIVALRMWPQHGLFLVVWLLLVPWMSDTGAYFTGVACGKHKLCPNISPKKTVEGLIGGLVISTAICIGVAWGYQHFFAPQVHIHLWLVGAITLVGAVLSVFGDLLASLIKRQADIKDYGAVMPGHGGVMDRFDSFLFTAPFVYVTVTLWPVLT